MYDFWPRGDDSYSRAARLHTRIAFVYTVLILSGVYLLVRLFTC